MAWISVEVAGYERVRRDAWPWMSLWAAPCAWVSVSGWARRRTWLVARMVHQRQPSSVGWCSPPRRRERRLRGNLTTYPAAGTRSPRRTAPGIARPGRRTPGGGSFCQIPAGLTVSRSISCFENSVSSGKSVALSKQRLQPSGSDRGSRGRSTSCCGLATEGRGIFRNEVDRYAVAHVFCPREFPQHQCRACRGAQLRGQIGCGTGLRGAFMADWPAHFSVYR